jgi:hypothetical protein
MLVIAAALATLAALAACSGPREQIPITPKNETAGAAVVRKPAPDAPPPTVASVAPATPAPSVAAPAAPPVTLPPNAIYVCVAETGGARRQTVIEYSPKVDELCRKHPEMGPCQYEREMCRRSGGRVYAAGGVEITQQTEAEYDKKVMRVRFKAN